MRQVPNRAAHRHDRHRSDHRVGGRGHGLAIETTEYHGPPGSRGSCQGNRLLIEDGGVQLGGRRVDNAVTVDQLAPNVIVRGLGAAEYDRLGGQEEAASRKIQRSDYRIGRAAQWNIAAVGADVTGDDAGRPLRAV